MSTTSDLHHVLEAVEAAHQELTILQNSEDWFVADSLDQLRSSIQLLRAKLGMDDTEYPD